MIASPSKLKLKLLVNNLNINKNQKETYVAKSISVYVRFSRPHNRFINVNIKNLTLFYSTPVVIYVSFHKKSQQYEKQEILLNDSEKLCRWFLLNSAVKTLRENQLEITQ